MAGYLICNSHATLHPSNSFLLSGMDSGSGSAQVGSGIVADISRLDLGDHPEPKCRDIDLRFIVVLILLKDGSPIHGWPTKAASLDAHPQPGFGQVNAGWVMMMAGRCKEADQQSPDSKMATLSNGDCAVRVISLKTRKCSKRCCIRYYVRSEQSMRFTVKSRTKYCSQGGMMSGASQKQDASHSIGN